VSRIIFVTGTDTGVGKTLLTASLLLHLRQTGRAALAMKPFCSGDREDVERIRAIQGSDPPMSEINPFYFTEPIAPLLAARNQRCAIERRDALRAIERMRDRCDCLIVEGAGGLLAPLGNGFSALEIIESLPESEVVIVAPNKLGTLNHTRLTAAALQARGTKRMAIVLMDQRTPDLSALTNAAFLKEVLAPTEVFSIPFLGGNALEVQAVEKNLKKIKKTLAQLGDPDSFSARSLEGRRKAASRTG